MADTPNPVEPGPGTLTAEDDAAGLTRAVAEVTTILDEVLGRIERLEDAQQDGEGKQRKWARWSWRHVQGDQRRELWDELAAFVQWINHRFGQHSNALQIQPCWYQHPVVIEELTAMMLAWQNAMAGGRKPHADYSAWFTYWFYPRMAALREPKNTWGLGKCISEHREPDSITPPQDTPAEVLSDHIEADVQHHEETEC